VALVLVGVPSVALAAHASSSAPMVTYALHGTLSNYVPATASSEGSITIKVTIAYQSATPLKGMTLTFAVNANTKVVLHQGKPIANGDLGTVKIRAPRGATAIGLQTRTAFKVVDRGAGTSSSAASSNSGTSKFNKNKGGAPTNGNCPSGRNGPETPCVTK
jgi:hypothetical protein